MRSTRSLAAIGMRFLPEEVSFEVGAAASVVTTTAWLAFGHHASLIPASTCLVHGGTGGVGHVAVQVAAQFGATVVATAGTPEARETSRELSADIALDYNSKDLASEVRNAVSGVDVVLDHRVGEHLQTDLDVLAADGTVVIIGGPGDECTITDLWPAIRTDATMQVFAMSNASDLGVVLSTVAELLATDKLDVNIAREYDLEDAGEAQRAVMEDSFYGKLVAIP